MTLALRRRSVSVAPLVALLLALASTASATVMVELPLDDLIRSADTIVHGVVTHSGVRVAVDTAAGSAEPQTITTIAVREWVAGSEGPRERSGGETVTLRELGGVWQGGGLHYEGTPRYAVGEEVVVFLERRPEAPHDLRTLGMVQGKFTVRHGVPGVPASVRRDLEGIAFASWIDGRQVVSAPGQEPAMELGTFLDHVRRVRAEGGQ